MEKINKKIIRFLELSGKFSRTFDEIFPKENNNYNYTGHLTMTNSLVGYSSMDSSLVIDGREIFIDSDGVLKAKDKKILTAGDKFRAEGELKAKLSDEFDSYNNLKKELTEYFEALKKITE